MTIEQNVINIVTKELRMKPGTVELTSNLIDDLGADSLDAVELIVAMEDKFKIVFPEKSHEGIVTVQDIANLVKDLTKG